ncbi:hypothetical protein EVAR_32011_1 [Eumeta japonica]|uniref:Uncharacterized protein n=1 Tax=Eumeta variegata TaxID=151549 RepID=A0A4C1YLI6_EUMVA|nr:hypothetical protein EVAR_32011_1 [Eumeta japonica]
MWIKSVSQRSRTGRAGLGPRPGARLRQSRVTDAPDLFIIWGTHCPARAGGLPAIVFNTVLLVLLLTSGVRSSVLKEAVEEHLKDVTHSDGAESANHEKQKGEKVHNIESELDDSHKIQKSKATDEAKYIKKDRETKHQTEGDSYEGHNEKQDKAEDSEASGFKRGHKKGHHKQGFQNSYHKDESSNKSTYFDDFNDEGDQAKYNSRLNRYDDQGGRRYQGSHNNGQEYVRDNYHAGGYNRHGDVANKHVGHRDYGKKYYLDDVSNYNKYHKGQQSYDRGKQHDRNEYHQPVQNDRGWDWKGWDDRRGFDDGWQRPDWRRDPGWESDPGWGRDYGGPGYYDDHGSRHEGGYGYGPYHGYGYGYESRTAPVAQPGDAPIVAQRKQTITIYEDPRYDGKDRGQLRREEGDYLQLEFKPSTHRYASYDDTYYVPAKNGGVEESTHESVKSCPSGRRDRTRVAVAGLCFVKAASERISSCFALAFDGEADGRFGRKKHFENHVEYHFWSLPPNSGLNHPRLMRYALTEAFPLILRFLDLNTAKLVQYWPEAAKDHPRLCDVDIWDLVIGLELLLGAQV